MLRESFCVELLEWSFHQMFLSHGIESRRFDAYLLMVFKRISAFAVRCKLIAKTNALPAARSRTFAGLTQNAKWWLLCISATSCKQLRFTTFDAMRRLGPTDCCICAVLLFCHGAARSKRGAIASIK